MPDLTPEEARQSLLACLRISDGEAYVLATHADALAAAVRRDTLAKVREVVEPLFTWDKESHARFRAALDALEG